MKKTYQLTALMAALSISTAAMAADLEISVTNLTQGIHFTPLLITAHTGDAHLFEVGQTASAELQAMAEGGDISGLAGIADSISANSLANPAGGLLNPGMTASGELMTDDGNMYLSITGMMLPTNDGFVGLDSWMIPSDAGTYTTYLNAYDAGTEANDEIRGSGALGMPGIPVPPPLEPLLGANGTGVTSEESNSYIHIHRGNLGDDNATGGTSDFNNTVHRWLNPVAKVTVTVR
ncbi:hypothetical protein HR060_16280 [Catenovulum sp. SM1970]|uniref:spondin domain-containing protein n=1 Tax=Marinifaba aquimaris TaxID=2741323 RepID=UPI00157391F0|nr:spondin domain-containing protein [Marinifaba aquimaris]NTS78407.1 hypothetical protein [Marinifaba aquimaris]